MNKCKNILISVFAIANVRSFLEVGLQHGILISPEQPLETLTMYFLHYTLFYYVVFGALSLLLYSFAYKNIKLSEAYTVGATAMCLIFIAPIIDRAFFEDFKHMAYPVNPWNVICNLHHFFDVGYDYHGLSYGMRVEIAIAGIAAMVYLYMKNKRVGKSILGGLCISITCLTIGLIVPFLAQYYEHGFNFVDDYRLRFSTLLHGGFIVNDSSLRIALLYIIISIVLFAIGYYIRNKEYFWCIVRNFRFSRAVHYILLLSAGMLYIYNNPPLANPRYENFDFLQNFGHPCDVFAVLMAAAAIFFSFESAVIFNDIYDYDVDRISNKNRPLVTKAIPLDEFKFVGVIFLILSLMIAICINPTFFFLVLVYHLAAFLYSAPPVRLRKYFIISNLLLSFIFLLTFYAGTSVIIPIFRLENVPSYLSLALLICFFFALTIKDIKDSDGDRIAHIQTLSTIFSPKVGNIVTIVCVCIAILLSPWLFRLPNLHIFSVIICAAFLVGIRFISNAKAKEIFVTALYFLYVEVLMWGVIF